MTTEEIKDYYANLLILQYRSKPKARAHAKALAGLNVFEQLPIEVKDAFDLENASGVQLDVIGKIVGASRTSGGITLTDNDYNILIKIKILSNSNGSSTFDIDSLLYEYFEENILFFNYKTMRVSYFVKADLWSEELARVVVNQGLLPYPMAVERSSIVYATDLTNFYGYRTYKEAAYNNSPMNTYDDFSLERPWLTYGYAELPGDQSVYFLLTDDGELLDLGDGGGLIL